MQNILVLHGPNLNLLGIREPHTYGRDTLAAINAELISIVQKYPKLQITCKQSNAEHILIEYIHQSLIDNVTAIIINPAAFTHTSIALRDALLAVNIPFIEVHLSNIYSREPFRHHSYFSDKALAIISGMGAKGYEYALHYLLHHFKKN